MGNTFCYRNNDACNVTSPLVKQKYSYNAKLFTLNIKGILELVDENVVFHFKFRGNKEKILWPIETVRSFGYGEDVFYLSVGRLSPTGVGIVLFTCKHALTLSCNLAEFINFWKASVSQKSKESRVNYKRRGDEIQNRLTSTLLNKFCIPHPQMNLSLGNNNNVLQENLENSTLPVGPAMEYTFSNTENESPSTINLRSNQVNREIVESNDFSNEFFQLQERHTNIDIYEEEATELMHGFSQEQIIPIRFPASPNNYLQESDLHSLSLNYHQQLSFSEDYLDPQM